MAMSGWGIRGALRDKAACCGCAACRDACPAGAVRMVMDGEGFWYPETDPARCSGCGRCEAVCPLGRERDGDGGREFFGARAREDALRLGSSSGGVFPVLAEYVLDKGGAVFGAAFGEAMEVAHREARTREELEALRRTKYVQSRMEGVYRRVQALLAEGAWVLFCGTPCQALALRRFLGREEPRLILADLVCYGAPSPGLWRDYAAYLTRRHGPLTSFSFRDKRNHDHGHTRAYTAGGREYADPLERDLYCGLYFDNLSIRPSCHACPFSTPDRESDFTLGDFWGVEAVRRSADDGMGVSLVALHTDKARSVWREVRERLDWFACEEEEALQPRLRRPTEPSRFRGLFMGLYRCLPAGAVFALYRWKRAAAGALRRRGVMR